MKITSQEIKQHVFEKSFRGYSIDEVDTFLDNIASEFEKIQNESKMLKMQLEIAEKETSKLREVEMTLIRTLRTAEDTSTKITESAKLSADKTLINAETEANNLLSDAKLKASQIINDAENKASILIDEAEQKSNNVNAAAKLEFAELEQKYSALEAKRNALLAQLKNIVVEGEDILNHNKTFTLDAPVKSSPVLEIETPKIAIPEPENTALNDNDSNQMLIANAVENESQKNTQAPLELPEIENEIEPEIENELSFSSAVNAIQLEPQDDKTNLEIIEGIGPKIKAVLNSARIVTFRDLATTPIYRIKDILEAAGPHFAIHDPSTWLEQALLADQGLWEQLESLKEYLVAGRKPTEPTMSSNKSEPSDANTEEMIDKVNKVKAAIRKSLLEKPENDEQKHEAPKTINEYIAEQRQNNGGSFFDSLN